MRRGLCEILSSLEGMNRIGVLKECVHRRRRKIKVPLSLLVDMKVTAII